MEDDILIQTIKELLASEDSTGCSEDLTVVSAESILKLKRLMKDY
jgi:hypothetical protein